MATINIVIVFCEGPHDVAFLSKILKSNGYSANDNSKIGEYPVPYNQLLENEVKKSDIKGLNIQEYRSVMLPSATLKFGVNELFLYAVGGDTRKDKRQKLLSDINAFIPKSDGEFEILPKQTKLSALYFFDSDTKGTQVRLQEVASEIKEIIDAFDNDTFDGNSTQLFDSKLSIGAYIFSAIDSDMGKLEDIMLPIMKQDNDNIFDNAESFIDENHDIERSKGKKFNKQKSIIGTAGQLQKSGSSNVVCIGQTDFLSEEKIKADVKCIEIIGFFNQFIEN